ncbi:unnamed protein product [Linum trigynum]|uniref:Uncharacterized protein n=1 Tax=Linum trigynum TaxID=586398 RepID=A0AAV2FUV0_9ROSI
MLKRSSVLQPTIAPQVGIKKPRSVSSSIQHNVAAASFGTAQQGKHKGLSSALNFNVGGSTFRRQSLLGAFNDMHEMTIGSSHPSPHMREATVAHVAGYNSSGNMALPPTVTQPEIPRNATPDAFEPAREEDSSQHMEEGTPTTEKRKTRGLTRGVGLHKQNERAGEKLRVVIDLDWGRPLDPT